MAHDFLSQILILLAGSLLVLSLVRRFKLPPILGYLLVGMVLGPHALGLVPSDAAVQRARRDRRRVPGVHAGTRVLAGAHGRDEVRGARHRRPADAAVRPGVRRHGLRRSASTPAPPSSSAARSRCRPPRSCCGSSATSWSSRARTRGSRVGILLFQDLAFAPLLALATALSVTGDVPGPLWLLGMAGARPGRARRRAGRGTLAAAAAVPRDRASPQHRDLHADGAVRVAARRPGPRTRLGPVDGARRIPGRHAARRDRVQAPDRGRDQAVPGHPARPVLRLRRHAARPAPAAHAAAARAAAASRCCCSSRR